MHSTKYSEKKRAAESSTNKNKGLLEQFVNSNNIKCIVKHFKYFWDIEEVYDIMVELVVDYIKGK
jgi:hypothetical protein